MKNLNLSNDHADPPSPQPHIRAYCGRGPVDGAAVFLEHTERRSG
jgi:hypothetical protein